MTLTRRQKLTIALLVLYWPTIFVLTHLSPMNVSQILSPISISDKILHFVAYMLLVFLFWFAVSPDKKVNWKKPTVWWILLVIVWYGAMDEWIQGYVGRDPDTKDFMADLAGALTSLVILTVLSFWSAVMVLVAITIFVMTNMVEIDKSYWPVLTNAFIMFFAYGFFTLLWVRYIHHYLPFRAPRFKWLICALAVPIGLLICVETFYLVTHKVVRSDDVTISLIAIAAVVATFFTTAIIRQKPIKPSTRLHLL